MRFIKILLIFFLLPVSCDDDNPVVPQTGNTDGEGSESCPQGFVEIANFDEDCVPEEFMHNSSTQTHGYFFEDVLLDNQLIVADDWVGAFKGEICLGAQKWDTAPCLNNTCDIVVNGNDGSDATNNYIMEGEIPSFKIFKNGTYHTAHIGNVILNNAEWIYQGTTIIDWISSCSDGSVPNQAGNCQ